MAERPRFEEVTVDKLTRVYGATRALAGVSLRFRAGEVCSVEGSNGAGKSTLLLVLATLVKPTSGAVRYGDYALPDDRVEVRAGIGLVGHEAMVYPDLTCRESLQLMATLHDLDAPEARIAEALRAVSLHDLADRPARTLSRGQLQRLALARAELHDPSLLLFDEPTTGLDVHATERLAVIFKRDDDAKTQTADAARKSLDPKAKDKVVGRRVRPMGRPHPLACFRLWPLPAAGERKARA